MNPFAEHDRFIKTANRRLAQSLNNLIRNYYLTYMSESMRKPIDLNRYSLMPFTNDEVITLLGKNDMLKAMPKPHKHADLLRYAADNADAEFITATCSESCPDDHSIIAVLKEPGLSWRIKPKTEVRYQWAFQYKFGEPWEITELHYANGEGINQCYQAQRLDFTAKEFEI